MAAHKGTLPQETHKQVRPLSRTPGKDHSEVEIGPDANSNLTLFSDDTALFLC